MTSIVRVDKRTNYTVIDNTALRDDRLSWKAKGLMAYMLSMPDDWTFYMDELQKHATDGRSSFRSGFDELKKLGYVERKRKQNADGTFQWETIVHEQPCVGFPQVDKPQVDIPQVEKPSMDNRTLLSTNKLSTYKQNTDIQSTDDIDSIYISNEYKSRPQKSSASSSMSDNHFSDVLKSLESILPPMQQQQLYGGILGEEVSQDYDEFGYELLKEAIRRTAVAGKGHYGYVRGILRNWQNEGVQSIEDVKGVSTKKKTVEDIMNDPTMIAAEKEAYIANLRKRGEL